MKSYARFSISRTRFKALARRLREHLAEAVAAGFLDLAGVSWLGEPKQRALDRAIQLRATDPDPARTPPSG